MGELESLLLVLALIYLSECLVWVRRGALAIRNWRGRNSRIVDPGALLGNQRGGFLLANPLPPLGNVFVSPWFPVSLSPDGLFAYSSSCLSGAGRASQTARYVRFEDIRDVAIDGRQVLVNGGILLCATSTFAARSLVESLGRLRTLPRSGRAEAIKRLVRDGLDADAVSRRLGECRSRSGRIPILSNTLFVYLFLVVVPLVWRYGFGQFGLWLLGGMLAQTVTIGLLFRRAHRVLYPAAGEERFKLFLTMLLAPPTAIRAPDILARHLLEDFHPLAAAKVLCQAEDFKRFARRVLLDLRYPLHPICPVNEPAAIASEQWFRAAMGEAVEKFIQQVGLEAHELTLAPVPTEPANQSYCPRCGAQFVVREGTCADCGGRPLERFGSAEAETR